MRGKCDFDSVVAVGAGQAGLSISQAAGLQGFSHATVCRVFTEKKWKTSSEQQFCEQRHLVDEKGQRRMARQVQCYRNSNNHALHLGWAENQKNFFNY